MKWAVHFCAGMCYIFTRICVKYAEYFRRYQMGVIQKDVTVPLSRTSLFCPSVEVSGVGLHEKKRVFSANLLSEYWFFSSVNGFQKKVVMEKIGRTIQRTRHTCFLKDPSLSCLKTYRNTMLRIIMYVWYVSSCQEDNISHIVISNLISRLSSLLLHWKAHSQCTNILQNMCLKALLSQRNVKTKLNSCTLISNIWNI